MVARKHKGSLLFPLILVFLGIMFLLVNLGAVDRTIWSEVVRYWPVLLILMGIDALVRRSSISAALGTIVGAAVLIAAGLALFHLFAPEAWITEQQAFAHPVDGATAAEVILSCSDCSMDIRSHSGLTASEYVIAGSLTLRRDEHLTKTVQRDDGTTHFRLESEYRLPFLLSAEREARLWEADLSESIPLTLSVETNGRVNLDLTNVLLTSADISTGDDPCMITASRVSSATLYLSGSRIEVHVPQGTGIRVSGTASMGLIVPPDYVRVENEILSPDYESASHRTDIALRPGAEWIEILPIISDPSTQAP